MPPRRVYPNDAFAAAGGAAPQQANFNGNVGFAAPTAFGAVPQGAPMMANDGGAGGGFVPGGAFVPLAGAGALGAAAGAAAGVPLTSPMLPTATTSAAAFAPAMTPPPPSTFAPFVPASTTTTTTSAPPTAPPTMMTAAAASHSPLAAPPTGAPPLAAASAAAAPPTSSFGHETHLPPSHVGGHRHYPIDPESQDASAPPAMMQQPQLQQRQPQQPQQQQQPPPLGAQPQSSPAFGAALVGGNSNNSSGAGGAPMSTLDAKSEPQSDSQCPSAFVRMTYNCFPNTSELQQAVGIPHGAVIHPLSPEADVPIVNFGRSPIPRCRSCRAYINPFVQWLENGRRWRCNFCQLTINDAAPEYVCALGADGERLDRAKRAELLRGAVEFVAPSEYMVRAPQPPTFVYVVDVSYASVRAGVVGVVANAIRRAVDELASLERANFALITYDDFVNFYSFKEDCDHAQMHVMTDVDDPFVPTSDVLLASLGKGGQRTAVDALLTNLATMFNGTRASGQAAGAALQSAFHVLRAVGGKVILYAAGRTSIGVGRMPPRDVSNSDPHRLLLAEGEASEFYKTLALDCSRCQIAIDVNLFGSGFCDVANFNSLPHISGGELRRYGTTFSAEQINGDAERTAARETGLEAVMRVRVSKGLSVSAHHGNLFIRSADLLQLPVVDADKAFAIQFKSDGLATARVAAMQAALLYTTARGQRRIRVLTVSLPVVSNLASIFKHADIDGVVNLTTKMAIKKALESTLADAREALVNKCVDILAVYRKVFASPQTPPGQLVLPETLKQLPLSVLALVKSEMLRSGMDVTADARAALMARLRTAPVDLTRVYSHPRLYDVDALLQLPNVLEAGDPPPSSLRLSAEALRQDGAFLLDDGLVLRLWIGRNARPQLVASLLAGVTSSTTANESADIVAANAAADSQPLLRRTVARVRVRGDGAPVEEATIDGGVGRAFAGLLDLLRDTNAWLHQPVQLARETVDLAVCADFLALLVEDRSASVFSYYEFLVQLQNQIQQKLK